MLAILSALIGFLSPFLPVVLRLLEQKQDNAHELAMFKLRVEASAKEHLYRMEEISARADIEESKVLHQPMASFGVQVLDAAKDSGWGAWAVVPAFYMFTILDFINGVIRPGITIWITGFYTLFKYSLFKELTGPRFEASGWSAISQIWSEADTQIVFLVIGYWFGNRVLKAMYGGSASSARSS